MNFIFVTKNGSKANIDKIQNVIDLSVDRKIVNSRPLNIVLELAHSTCHNKKRSEHNIIIL